MALSADARAARQLSRNLRLITPQVDRQIKREMKELARPVAEMVRPQVAKLTGQAAASVKPTTKGTNPAVQGGGAAAPYFGWLEFGGGIPRGRRRGRRGRRGLPIVKEGRTMYPTAEKHRDAMAPRIAESLSRWIEGET